MSSQIKKKFIESNAIDGSKLLLSSNETVRSKKADGSVADLFKLDVSDKLMFLVSPKNASNPVDADDLARKGYVDQKIADLVDSAPALLDTLNELAAAISDDPNFATTVTSAVASVQSGLDAEITRAEGVEADLQGQITALSGSSGSDLANEIARAEAAEAALQSEIDTTQVGAGLETDGSYTAPMSSNYLGSATSLKDADSVLDSQIKSVADGLAQEVLDRASDVDAEESRALAAEGVIADNLAQEILDRTADVDAEESRAIAAEGVIASGLAQEILDRAADVDAEETRASNEEATLVKLDGSRPMTGSLDMDQHGLTKVTSVSSDSTAGLAIENTASGSSAGISLKGQAITLTTPGASPETIEPKLMVFRNDQIPFGDYAPVSVLENMSMMGKKISHLSQPADDSDASTKKYVDDSIVAESATKLPLAGGSMQGDIDMSYHNVWNVATLEAYTEENSNVYIDITPSQINLFDDEIGSSLAFSQAEIVKNNGNFDVRASGDLKLEGLRVLIPSETDMQSHKIIGLSDGSAASDAATVGQVTSSVSSEADRATAAEGVLSSRITALEGVAVQFSSEKFILSATDISNGYIELAHIAVANSMNAFVDRLAVFESDDYTLSTVGSVTRVTFVGNLVAPSEEQLSSGDVIRVKYAYEVL